MAVYSINPSLISLFFAFSILSSHTLFSICNGSDESEVEDETLFTYEEGTGKGPRKWGQINPLWQVCDKGKLQSPIDLLDQRVQVIRNLGKLKRDYNPAHATIKNRGHDVSMRWKEDAGKIIINGTDFKLLQCHWHSPSEHTFNGTRYKLELHIVHQSSNGMIAVIGITYKYGHPDPFLAKLLSHITSIGKEEKDIGVVNPGHIKFGSRKYYRYIGSLTVPPCTEGVIWTIVKKVRTVSREQVRALRDVVHDVSPYDFSDFPRAMCYFSSISSSNFEITQNLRIIEMLQKKHATFRSKNYYLSFSLHKSRIPSLLTLLF